MKPLRVLTIVTLALALSACASRRIREGTVISKHACKGLAFDTMVTTAYFRLPKPDVFWVDVQGKNAKGKLVKKHVVVFRADWKRIDVGDHWSAAGGFESGCCSNCCEHK
jgi:hypothetical protein